MKPSWALLVLATSTLLAARPLAAALEPGQDLTKIPLEDLANIQVTSASRMPERAFDATSAVHVLPADQLSRLGGLRLVDALRLAPGVQVSRITAGTEAVAVRGFASRLSRSVLVLIDGRSVWTPLFAGVYWETQDVLMEDLDRIEINRGPGGALFGANAINGVISVFSRSAKDTQGGLAVLGGGTEERAFGRVRYGGKTGDVFYRVYAKYSDRDQSLPTGPGGYDDAWHLGQGGFRLDRQRGNETWTVQGDVFKGATGERATYASYTPPFAVTVDGDADFSGRNLLARWTHGKPEGRNLQVQAYYDNTHREEPYYDEGRNTFDLDIQYRLPHGQYETIVGADYRASRGDFNAVPTVAFHPADRRDDLAGIFGQEEWRSSGGRLRASLGAKAEWNDYSGWNLQPSVRVGFKPGARQTLWASAARSVRTASRLEHDVSLDTSLNAAAPLFARALGNSTFEPESVVTWELGYRTSVGPRALLGVSLFRAHYDDLATLEPGTPFREQGGPGEPARTIVPVRFDNLQEAVAKGGEVASTVAVMPDWRLKVSYSYLFLEQTPKPGSADLGNGYSGNTPRHQGFVASFLTLRGVSFDVFLRAASRVVTHKVPSFWDTDARVAFRPAPHLELSLVGQNLARASHVEFGGGFAVQRGAYIRAALDW